MERLDRLETELTGDDAQEARRTRLEGLTNRIAGLTVGVFAPWSKRTVVKAILVPFGGAGAIAVLDILAKSGL